jgi:hypothetical protein
MVVVGGLHEGGMRPDADEVGVSQARSEVDVVAALALAAKHFDGPSSFVLLELFSHHLPLSFPSLMQVCAYLVEAMTLNEDTLKAYLKLDRIPGDSLSRV